MSKNKKKIIHSKEIIYNNLGQFNTRTKFYLKLATNFYRLIIKRGL